MQKVKTSHQLVPPHNHRANASERAIQTFKNHFKAGLGSVDPDFPMGEWDRLLPQAFLTLNLLRRSRINPKLSAHAFIFGQFDFQCYTYCTTRYKGNGTQQTKQPSLMGSQWETRLVYWSITTVLSLYEICYPFHSLRSQHRYTTVEATTVVLVAISPSTAGPMEHALMTLKIVKTKRQAIKMKQLSRTRWEEVPTIAMKNDS